MKKENKGITLIALVITIIVLLILAAITINLTVGDQGIITRAQQAAIEYAHATLWESMQLQYSNYRLDLNRANGEFLKYLQDKDIIGTELDGGGYIINVKNLLGEKLQIGNGTSGENDVYKITEVTHEGDNNIEYKVEYFGKSGNVELGVLSDKLAQIEAGGEGGDEPQESEAYFEVSKQIVSTPSNGEYYDAGDTIIYEITVKNLSNTEVKNIHISDILEIGNRTYKPGNTRIKIIEKTVDILKGNEEFIIEKLTANQTATFRYSYTVQEKDRGLKAINRITKLEGMPRILTGALPENTLLIGKEEGIGHLTIKQEEISTPTYYGDGNLYGLGETIQIKVTFINDGERGISNINLESTKNLYDGTKTINIDYLAAGESKEYIIEYEVYEADILMGNMCITNEIKYDGTRVWKSMTFPTGNEEAFVKIDIEELTEPKNGYGYEIGEIVQYKIKITNKGSYILQNVDITNPYGSFDEIDRIEKLEIGESKEFTVSKKIMWTDIEWGDESEMSVYVNADYESWSGESENETFEESIGMPVAELNEHGSIEIKELSTPIGETYSVGETIQYEIKYTNDGNYPLSPTIEDKTANKNWPDYLEPDNSLNVGTYTSQYTVTQEDVNRGSVNIVVNVTFETFSDNETNVITEILNIKL